MPGVITTISFDQGDTDYKLNFNFGGMLNEKQLKALIPIIGAPEVLEIITPRNVTPQISHTPQTKIETATPDAGKAAEDDKKKKAEEEKAKKAADKKAKDDAKKAADAAAAAQASTLDLGLGGEEETKAEPAPGETSGPSDDDLINALGL